MERLELPCLLIFPAFPFLSSAFSVGIFVIPHAEVIEGKTHQCILDDRGSARPCQTFFTLEFLPF
ncbi:MAG: hypothetical protein IJ229_13670, partial [Clostridia bacterium]|nr:hypothetical protein [Clostridia bacterium]